MVEWLSIRRLAFGLTALLLCSACASIHPREHSHIAVKPVPPGALVDVAMKLMGAPYHYGGKDPREGFDCSGLVCWSYERLGSWMPRTAHEQYRTGRPVNKDELRPGDLVFFNLSGYPGHVGIVTKPPKFIHAPAHGQKVREDNLEESYWSEHYMGARRVD